MLKEIVMVILVCIGALLFVSYIKGNIQVDAPEVEINVGDKTLTTPNVSVKVKGEADVSFDREGEK